MSGRDVVVGYDGSPTARRAVEFAAFEAAEHGSRLRIVAAWTRSVTIAAIPPAEMPVDTDHGELAVLHLEEAATLARELAPGLEVATLSIEGDAGTELVRAAANARLLVVGCRGHGHIHLLVLGSVSHYCTLHARCPVLVIPPLVDDGPPA